MKKYYRLIAGAVLTLIAIIWICFLALHEPEDTASQEIKDAVTAQLNETKQKIENSVTKIAEQPTSVPTSAEPEVTVTPEPVTDALTPTPTPLVAPEYIKFDYIIANVNDKMNVREGAGQNKKVVGTLPANGYGKVIERGNEWFKIKSGNITGYVSTQYILKDTEAVNKIRELGALKIKVTGNDVNVRREPNTTCEVRLQAKQGTTYDYYPEYSTQLFYAVMIDKEISYISTTYAEVTISLETAYK